ncbi:MarR family transcriptional regulator [Comamonas sp. Y33R10-2]|uniref:MarR family winged helix-turn-helix transcriptional regulator n=1 Tax=Comamonas sp. Y33R10-2 TaxID=2853257 RepID=UPI001C5CABFF|nr:MarR family transcriptional regulator [Comamonas sp. Y33R10-2]QXZ08476.1 MarR family transcriptional regulator [Comamonas sp. Y33R10-2]
MNQAHLLETPSGSDLDNTTFPRLEVETFPGHGIRRLQQVAVAMFTKATDAWAITPLQFAVLQKLVHLPGIDQRTLSVEVGFDKATIGGVIDRLEARGLLQRQQTEKDRRVRLISLTPEGEALLISAGPAVLQAQHRMLEPLSEEERETFAQLMRKVIEHHEQSGQATVSTATSSS